ncbi:MAG: ABC transporter ATP-binding protein [Chloroflexi bacterium]|nr:ABC transporter ATP-binding protein [Chloroflexota bacterium]
MLEVREVSTYYGHIKAIEGVSLDLREGEIACIIGANGAGKSTLMKTISGIIRPSTGTIVYAGRDITSASPDWIVSAGVCQVPEGRQLFSSLTVLDNLLLGAYSHYGRLKKAELAEDLEKVFHTFPRLSERQKQRASTLSGGEQQMLAIGRALMSKPKLLLLDEPSLGLAPLVMKDIFRIIVELRERGISILLVEQNARAALGIADRAFVMQTGKVVLHGAASALRENPEVKRHYLGA